VLTHWQTHTDHDIWLNYLWDGDTNLCAVTPAKNVPFHNAKESVKVILVPNPESDQHQTLITCRGSGVTHAYQVWSTVYKALFILQWQTSLMNKYCSTHYHHQLSCGQTNTLTDTHSVITIPAVRTTTTTSLNIYLSQTWIVGCV